MAGESKVRYAVVGAGIAGVSAAEAIREIDPEGPILLVNGESVPPYCRPLIVEVLRGERTFDDIHLRDPAWFPDKNITLVGGDPAKAIHIGAKMLRLESGREFRWEKLLLATGSKPAVPAIPGLDGVPACTLYRQQDVEDLQPLCRPGARALLIGMGLIGLQAATSLRERGVDVVAVELMPKILPLILDVRAAAYAERRLEEHGVEVRTGTSVREVKPGGGAKHPALAVLSTGETVGFDFAVLSTGMNPDLALLDGSGIEMGRGVRVSDGMETSVPGVYAAGDITEYPDWIEGRAEIHAHWVNAYRQGRIAGLRMAGEETRAYEPVYLNSLSVFGLPIITFGASRADDPEGAEVHVSDVPARPAYTRLVVKDGRLVAATFLNTGERAGVFQYLMRERVDVAAVAESLFEQGLPGVEFLDQLHRKSVRGDVEWPETMDLILKYRKDQRHTRWGATQEQRIDNRE